MAGEIANSENSGDSLHSGPDIFSSGSPEASWSGERFASFRAAYSRFLTPGRILLTGHSHQAWPDVARAAQVAYFDESATFVDDKWGEAVFPRIERVSRKIIERAGLGPSAAITFGKSTHELVFRLLTCFRWSARPRVVTTSAEFHSLRRQLSRLEEEGVEVVWVDATDRATLAERLIAAITPGTSLVALSSVIFEDAWVVGEAAAIARHALSLGAEVLLDSYHGFNVAPVDLGDVAHRVFTTAGGYKYAQFGEGVCWLTLPDHCSLRPAYTGWFADFGSVATAKPGDIVTYSSGGDRFAGATFDPSGIYRAEAVLDHFDAFGLDVASLRKISVAHTSRIISRLDALGFDPSRIASSRDSARRAGFVSLRVARCDDVVDLLRKQNVFVDARRELLRLGPAPYLSLDEIDDGVQRVVDAIRLVERS